MRVYGLIIAGYHHMRQMTWMSSYWDIVLAESWQPMLPFYKQGTTNQSIAFWD